MTRVLALVAIALAFHPMTLTAQTAQDGKVCWEETCQPFYRESALPSTKPQMHLRSQRSSAVANPSTETIPGAKVAFQISRNDVGLMNLALNNAVNIIDHYRKTGQRVDIEIVAYGPGLQMLRSDSTPVRERLAQVMREHTNIRFVACRRSLQEQSSSEEPQITLLSGVSQVELGVAHLVELQEAGFKVLRP